MSINAIACKYQKIDGDTVVRFQLDDVGLERIESHNEGFIGLIEPHGNGSSLWGCYDSNSQFLVSHHSDIAAIRWLLERADGLTSEERNVRNLLRNQVAKYNALTGHGWSVEWAYDMPRIYAAHESIEVSPRLHPQEMEMWLQGAIRAAEFASDFKCTVAQAR